MSLQDTQLKCLAQLFGYNVQFIVGIQPELENATRREHAALPSCYVCVFLDNFRSRDEIHASHPVALL